MTATTSHSAAPTVALDPADEHVPFRPRRGGVCYDRPPPQWGAGGPPTTHGLQEFHLPLPAGRTEP